MPDHAIYILIIKKLPLQHGIGEILAMDGSRRAIA